jgi:hypothetical protein
MALNCLSTRVMIQVSQHWTQPDGAARRLLHTEPRFFVLLDDIDATVGSLIELVPSAEPEQRSLLTARAKALDREYRHQAHVLYGMLDLSARGSGNLEYARVRDLFFPRGLGHLNRSYRDKSGHALVVAEKVTSADYEVLKTIHFGGHTLDSVARRYLEVGIELGQVENQRAALASAARPTAGDVCAARNRWIRMVRALQAMARLIGLSQETDRLLFGPLRDAEADAARKRRARRVAPPSREPPDPLASRRAEPAMAVSQDGTCAEPEALDLEPIPESTPPAVADDSTGIPPTLKTPPLIDPCRAASCTSSEATAAAAERERASG